MVGIGGFLVSPVASAATCGDVELKAGESCCGNAVTTVLSCDQAGYGVCKDGTVIGKIAFEAGAKCKDGTVPDFTVKSTGIYGLLLLVINIFTAGIGIAAVGGIIYGSIMYASAGGNAEHTKKAKTIIFNVVFGLVVYALMYSFLNFIIPGGLFT